MLSWRCSAPIHPRRNPKNNSFTTIIFSTRLSMLRKTLILILFLSASTNTIQVQLSHQGHCSSPAAGCYSRLLQNVICLCCPELAYFLHRVGTQIVFTHVRCFSCKQSLSSKRNVNVVMYEIFITIEFLSKVFLRALLFLYFLWAVWQMDMK